MYTKLDEDIFNKIKLNNNNFNYITLNLQIFYKFNDKLNFYKLE